MTARDLTYDYAELLVDRFLSGADPIPLSEHIADACPLIHEEFAREVVRNNNRHDIVLTMAINRYTDRLHRLALELAEKTPVDEVRERVEEWRPALIDD